MSFGEGNLHELMAELKHENLELRELVGELFTCYRFGNSCDACANRDEDITPCPSNVPRRVKELGVEVPWKSSR